MKSALLLFYSILFSCSPATNKPEHGSLNSHATAESFFTFFNNFSKDSIFQIARIDSPLLVIKSDEVDESKEWMDVQYVSFKQKDWKETIKITIEELTPDTTRVLLQGEDTGIYLEHYFALRNLQWHLYKILNLST